MRLSRPRVILRAALLTAGGAFMLWRADDARRGARAAAALGAPDALLLSRVALVELLVGILALGAAALALAALRGRRRTHTLRLEDLDRGGRGQPPGGSGQDPGDAA